MNNEADKITQAQTLISEGIKMFKDIYHDPCTSIPDMEKVARLADLYSKSDFTRTIIGR